MAYGATCPCTGEISYAVPVSVSAYGMVASTFGVCTGSSVTTGSAFSSVTLTCDDPSTVMNVPIVSCADTRIVNTCPACTAFGTIPDQTMNPELFGTDALPTTVAPMRNCAVIVACAVNGGASDPPRMKLRPTIEFWDGAVIEMTPV